jgi:H+/Cl- antiporter ClcA
MNENESGLAPSQAEPASGLNRIRLAWSEYRLLCYAALLGVVGGLGAQLFVWILEFAERLLLVGIAGYQPPEPVIAAWGLWLIPLSTTLGGLLSGILVDTFAPEAEGSRDRRRSGSISLQRR